MLKCPKRFISEKSGNGLASSSSGKKYFSVKVEIGYNFKKAFRKPTKNVQLTKKLICAIEVESCNPLSITTCPALNKTPAKMWDISHKCVSLHTKQTRVIIIARKILRRGK